MKKVLILIFLIVFSAAFVHAEFRKVLVLELSYSGGTVTLTNLSTRSGYFFEEKNQPEDGYNSIILNKNGETEFQEKFQFPLIIEGIPQMLDKGEREIFVPYTENTEKLQVYSPTGEKVLEEDLSEFINVLKEDKKIALPSLTLILVFGLLVIIILTILVLIVWKKKSNSA